MAIYKIIPNKDSTIYQDNPRMNTGLDEILEIIPSEHLSSRMLIQFDQEDIEKVASLMQNEENPEVLYKVELVLYNAFLSNISDSLTLETYPISGSWDMGIGRYKDIPTNYYGVTWEYRKYLEGNYWEQEGGDYIEEHVCSSSYNYYGDLDLKFDVTNIVDLWYENVIENDGFLIKLNEEDDLHRGAVLKFYSRDTHTIYKPTLTFKWDDSIYEEGDNKVETYDILMSIGKKEEYDLKSIPKFNINVTERYPRRAFTVEYLYKQKHLPQESYYAIKDGHTGEYVIDFDENFTKISSQEGKSYFNFHTQNLNPNRHYFICIKTTINGSTIVWEDKNSFKVKA